MDLNYLFLFSMLPPGRYNAYRRRFEMRTKRVLLNHFCAAVCLFCGLKYCIIMILPQKTKSILYLCELYIYDTPAMLSFQFGTTIIHFSIFYVYLYMNGICRDASRFDCLRFLFIPSLNELCRCYQLDARTTNEFFRKAAYIRYLIYLIMISFEVFIFVLIARCLVIAYQEIELNSFLVFSLPLGLITWFSYQCLIVSIPTIFVFMFTTQAFLRLRFETVARQVRRFHKTKKSIRNRRRLQITQTINDIVRQFNAANVLFDDLV